MTRSELRRIGKPHGGRAEHGDRPPRGVDQFGGALDRRIGGGREPGRRRERRHRLVGRRQRHVFGQVEMHRPLRLAQGKRDGRGQRRADLALAQLQGRLGDRLEQRVMIDPHLDAPAELIGVEIAGDGDERRAVQVRAADAGGEIGRARPQRGDAKSRRAGDAPGDVGGKAGGAFVRGEHEIDAALAHRLHQRQHVAARNAEAAGDAGRLQRGDDQVGIVHGLLRRCCMGRALWHTSEPPIKLLRSARSEAGGTIDR